MRFLLPLVPLAILLHWPFHAPAAWQFLVAALAIIPLAGYMGHATEEVAHRTGPALGGLLNATLGNAAELILGLMMVFKGPELFPVVKASITGSIIGNLLLILGLAALLGGRKHVAQTFNRTAASSSCSMLLLAVAAMLMPAFYHLTAPVGEDVALVEHNVTTISLCISAVLVLIYAASLVFSLKTHGHLFSEEEKPKAREHASMSGTEFAQLALAESREPQEETRWTMKKALGVLVASAVGVGIVSEILVGSLEATMERFHLPPLFVGVVILAIVGNAAEHSAAVLFAMKNKFDLALQIAVGSSIQIALFVSPVLVFASLFTPHPMSLEFSGLEILAVLLSTLITSQITSDGETNWFEGLQLLALYAVLAVAFFFAR